MFVEPVMAHGVVPMSVAAFDPDGDALSYTWASDCGQFAFVDTAATEWTAPSEPSLCHIVITIRDARDGVASLALPAIHTAVGNTATIGSDGGLLALPSGITLEVPVGSLDHEVVFTLTAEAADNGALSPRLRLEPYDPSTHRLKAKPAGICPKI